MANQSILAAFERMWQHIIVKLGDKVDLTSEQTISGVKSFSNGIQIGGATLNYDNTNDALIISFDE